MVFIRFQCHIQKTLKMVRRRHPLQTVDCLCLRWILISWHVLLPSYHNTIHFRYHKAHNPCIWILDRISSRVSHAARTDRYGGGGNSGCGGGVVRKNLLPEFYRHGRGEHAPSLSPCQRSRSLRQFSRPGNPRTSQRFGCANEYESFCSSSCRLVFFPDEIVLQLAAKKVFIVTDTYCEMLTRRSFSCTLDAMWLFTSVRSPIHE